MRIKKRLEKEIIHRYFVSLRKARDESLGNFKGSFFVIWILSLAELNGSSVGRLLRIPGVVYSILYNYNYLYSIFIFKLHTYLFG